MRIIDEGTVYSSPSESGMTSCTFPQICVLPDGQWMCAFRHAPAKIALAGQQAVITVSHDEGKTWSQPVAPCTPPDIEGRAGLFRTLAVTSLGGEEVLAALCWVDHSDPSLPFFNETTEGLLDSRIFLARSGDMGKTWSAPARMDTKPFDVPTPLTGPVLVLSDGRWACQFELNKHYNDLSRWQHRSVLMFSHDQGKTWNEYAYTSPEGKIFYWDQRPSVLNDDLMLNVFWTFDTGTNQYLNIHARESTDAGKTWSDLWDTGVPGQPAPPVLLSQSRIGMVYVDRTGIPTIKFRLSFDMGKTWPKETELAIHTQERPQTTQKNDMNDAWVEMGAFSLGLPATALLPDDKILAVYYAGPHTDKTDIRFAVIGQ